MIALLPIIHVKILFSTFIKNSGLSGLIVHKKQLRNGVIALKKVILACDSSYFSEKHLQALFTEDNHQTREIANEVKCSLQAVLNHLKSMRKVQKIILLSQKSHELI